MDPNSIFLKRAKIKFFAIFCAIFSILSPLSILTNSAFAYEDNELICARISFKGEMPTSGASETKTLSVCSRITTDGKINDRVSITEDLSATSELLLKGMNITGSLTDNQYEVHYSYFEREKLSSDSINGTPTKSGRVVYKIGETKLEDLAKEIKDKLRDDEIEANGKVWKKQSNVEIITGSAAEDIASRANVTDLTEGMDDECQVATSLAWFLCPAIEILRDATTAIYDNVVEQFLQIDSGIFSGGNSAIYQAWQIFQNFANVALVIIVLFIVFSQLTGIGIDNYGIKKSLPKLIVAIVLVNLSYIIAQLCVDVANILGFSLRALFDGLTTGISLSGSGAGYGAALASGTAVTAAVVGTAIGVITATGAWATVGLALIAAIPAIIGGLLAALIAIAFLFILLSARQAGVILFVVISPLAIICYILPNTQGLFKKWLKIFEALLLVYPICGLLMGVGGFASVVLLAAAGGGAWISLVALLISVVPFFFIPTILRSSMAGLGNLGAKISGYGKSFGSKINGNARRLGSGIINNSEKYKTARENAARGRKLRYNRGVAAALGTRQENGEALSSADARRLALARQAVQKDEDENVIARESAIRNSGEIDDESKLKERLKTAISSDDYDGIRAYQNILSQKGESGRQAVHEAMAEVEDNASDKARQTYASNIMNKWASDYKNNSRSTFEYAKANTGQQAGAKMARINEEPGYIGNLTQEQLAHMDEKELGRLQTALRSGKLSGADAEKLRTMARETLDNKNLQGSIKGKQSDILKTIASPDTATGGASPATPTPYSSPTLDKFNTELDVPHSSNTSSTSSPAPNSTTDTSTPLTQAEMDLKGFTGSDAEFEAYANKRFGAYSTSADPKYALKGYRNTEAMHEVASALEPGGSLYGKVDQKRADELIRLAEQMGKYKSPVMTGTIEHNGQVIKVIRGQDRQVRHADTGEIIIGGKNKHFTRDQ